MINVVEVVNRLGLGGTEKTLKVLAKHLDKNAFRVKILCLRKTDGPTKSDVEKFTGCEVYDDRDSLFQDFKPDIVHVHRAGSAEEERNLTAFRDHGVKTLIETNVFGKIDQSPEEALIDCHLFVSYFCIKRYTDLVGKPLVSDRYKVLYNPIEVPPESAIDTAKKFSIGRISRADQWKWSDLQIEMFPHVLKRFPNLRYRINGETDAIREKFRQLGVEKNIDYLGPLRDGESLKKFYNSIDVFAHGSAGESFGLTIAEAMSFGRPVVTHNTFGNDNAQAEVVDHCVTGYVTNNVNEYVLCVCELMRNDELRRQLGRNAREKVVRVYRAETITRGLEEVFRYFHGKNR